MLAACPGLRSAPVDVCKR